MKNFHVKLIVSAAAFVVVVAQGAMIENEFVRVTVDDATGACTFTDKRNDRVWAPVASTNAVLRATDCRVRDGAIVVTLDTPALSTPLTATWSLDGAEALCVLSAPPAAAFQGKEPLAYPAARAARSDERFLLPQGSGYSYPADFPGGYDFPGKFTLYTRNYKMGIWAQHAESVLPTGEIRADVGYAAILETPEDARMDFSRRADGLRAMNVEWTDEKGLWGYDRRLRFVFFKETSLAHVADRYRKDMRAKGYLVTLREKQKARPHMRERYENLVGAPNVWYWGYDKVRVTRRLKRLGFDNFIMNCAGGAEAAWQSRSDAEEVQALATFDRVLVGCYDIFKDTITPALTNEVRFVSTDWDLTAEANDDLEMYAPGEYSRGWAVANKDPKKPFVKTYTICQGRIIDYARAKMTRLLKDHPFDARLLDVTGTGLSVCYHPKHAYTRRTNLPARQAFFQMFGDDFGQLAGTEEGMECYVPCCDYFEAMMSGPNEWRMDGGRYMWKVYPHEPEKVALGLRPDLRVPFWEMVFHECAVSYWYWTDHNNKYADAWWKRDLYNVLYATPPLYLFERREFARIQSELAASVARATLTAKAAGWDRMTDFRILTRDRSVQQTRFANGVCATVNFGDSPFVFPDGTTVPPRGSHVTGIPEPQVKVPVWLVADEEGRADELARKHAPAGAKILTVDLGATRVVDWTPRSGIVSVNALMDEREGRPGAAQPSALWHEKLSAFSDQKVDGVIWRQGAADAPEWRRFADHLHALERGLQIEFRNPGLTFVAVPIEGDARIRAETETFIREQNTFGFHPRELAH